MDVRKSDVVCVFGFLKVFERRVFVFLSFVEDLFGFDRVL